MSDQQASVEETSKKARESLEQRVARVKLALKLGRVYEFADVTVSAAALLDERPLLEHSWVSPKLVPKVAPATFSTFNLSSDGRHKIDLPHGVVALLGRAGAGKTYFSLEYLYAGTATTKGHKAVKYFKMFEPGDEYRLQKLAKEDSVAIPDFESDLAVDLASELVNPDRELLIVDSFRYLFYSSSGGATGKGGVNMSLFMDLTHLDALAAKFRKTIVVVINPMTDNQEAFDFYVEAARGAVAGVVVAESPSSLKMSSRHAGDRDWSGVKLPKFAPSAVRAKAESVGSDVDESNRSVNVASAVFGRKTK